MELAVITAFFVGLVWWEIILVLGLAGVFILSPYNDDAVPALFATIVFLVIPFSGTALITSFSITGLIAFVGIYLLIGGAWSLFKYYIEARKLKDKYFEGRYSKDTKTKEDVKFYISSHIHRGEIVYWVALWPINIIGYLFYDVSKKLIDFVVDNLGKTYDKITDLVVR